MRKRNSKKKLKNLKRDNNIVLHLIGEISLASKVVPSKKNYKRHAKHKRKEYV